MEWKVDRRNGETRKRERTRWQEGKFGQSVYIGDPEERSITVYRAVTIGETKFGFDDH